MRTLGALFAFSLLFTTSAALATPFTVYDDALSSSFSDKSLGAQPNYASTTNPYQGNDCISVQLFQQGYLAVASGGTPDISQYGGVDFWHRTSAGTMTLVVGLRSSAQLVGNTVSVSVTSTWTNAHLTLADFGLNQSSGTIVGIQFGTTTLNIPAIALDDITLFDATISDGGISDGGSLDGGSFDGGSFDGGSFDGGSFDASTFDGGSIDASTPDSGTSDGGSIDASPLPDASPKPDASAKDSGGVDSDAGGEPNDTNGGCSCDLATPTGYTSAIPIALVALALIARRRRS